MKTLHVLYDERCAFCLRCRGWLEKQPAFLELEFIPRGSPEVAERFPGIEKIDAADELVVISDTGALYQGANALVMCLWALREYREWSQRLASPTLLPLSRAAFDLISTNRLSISRLLGMTNEREIAEAINGAEKKVCEGVGNIVRRAADVCIPRMAPEPSPSAPPMTTPPRAPHEPPPLPQEAFQPPGGSVLAPRLALSAVAATWIGIDAADAEPQTIIVSNSGSGALDWRVAEFPWWINAERRGVELILSVKHGGTHSGEVRITSNGGDGTILVQAEVRPDAAGRIPALGRAMGASALAALAGAFAWLLLPRGILEPLAFCAAFTAVWASVFSSRQWAGKSALGGVLAGFVQCLIAFLPVFVSSATLRSLGPVGAVIFVTIVDAGRAALGGWIWGRLAGGPWLARRAAKVGWWVWIPALAINSAIAFSGDTTFASSQTQILLALVILCATIFTSLGAAIPPPVKRTRASFAQTAPKRAPAPPPPATPEPEEDEDDEPELFPFRVSKLVKFAILASLLTVLAVWTSQTYFGWESWKAVMRGGWDELFTPRSKGLVRHPVPPKQPAHELQRERLGMTTPAPRPIAGGTPAPVSPFGHEIWSFKAGQPIVGSAAMGPDGTLYFATGPGRIFALASDGSKKWERDSVASETTPVVGADGTIYIGSDDGQKRGRPNGLLALRPDGSVQWVFTPERPPASRPHVFKSPPAIGRDGTIYAVSHECALFAINPDGTQRWEHRFPGVPEPPEPKPNTPPPLYPRWTVASPVIGPDETIYFGSEDGRLHAVESNGESKWEFATRGPIRSTPAIGPDGRIYLSAHGSESLPKLDDPSRGMGGREVEAHLGHKIYGINPDGVSAWEMSLPGAIDSSPAFGGDGTVYFGISNSIFYAVTADGDRKWERSLDGYVVSSPALCADGTVLFGGLDHRNWPNTRLYALGADGKRKWEFSAGGQISASPLVGPDGVIYIGDHKGTFYAIRGSSPLARAPWPTYRADSRRTGLWPQDAPALASLPKAVLKRGTGVRPPAPPPLIIPGSELAPESLEASPPPRVGKEGTVLWQEASRGNDTSTAPLIAPDGTIYYGAKGTRDGAHTIVALQPLREERFGWTSTAGPYLPASIAPDGTIYAAGGNKLRALAPDHAPKWTIALPSHTNGSPAIAADGTAYLSEAKGGVLHAIHPDGREKWFFQSGRDEALATPAIAANGAIYVGTSSGSVFALNPDGQKLWELELGLARSIETAPAIAPDGTIYIAAALRLIALSPEGERKWEIKTSHRWGADENIVVTPAGTVLCEIDDHLWAIAPDGTIKWKFEGPPLLSSHVALAANGVTYVHGGTTLCAVHADGTERWKIDLDAGRVRGVADSITGLTLAADGTIYLTTKNQLYAIGGTVGPPAHGWPMHQRDAQRSGNAARAEPAPPPKMSPPPDREQPPIAKGSPVQGSVALAQALLVEVRQIDAAVDQWGIETNQREGTVPTPKDIAAYMKRGTRLHATLESGRCEDVFGNPLKLPPLGTPPSISRQSADQLSKVVPPDFWKPFKIE